MCPAPSSAPPPPIHHPCPVPVPVPVPDVHLPCSLTPAPSLFPSSCAAATARPPLPPARPQSRCVIWSRLGSNRLKEVPILNPDYSRRPPSARSLPASYLSYLFHGLSSAKHPARAPKNKKQPLRLAPSPHYLHHVLTPPLVDLGFLARSEETLSSFL